MQGPVSTVSSADQFVCKWGWSRWQGGPAEQASVELCNKEVVQSPSHRGRLAVQGRARFSTRSKVPTTQMLSWVASRPIRIPGRETTPALPDSESYLVPFSVCRGWRHLSHWEKSQSQVHTSVLLDTWSYSPEGS